MTETTAAPKNRREQIAELINTGNFTKKEIAAEIGIKETGVSSQLTYLRWLGNFIIWNEDKKLSFVSEDEFKAWEASKSTGKKTKSTSTRSASETHAALSKTIAKQEKDLAKWNDKLSLLEADETTDNDLIDEAAANIKLLEIKLRRNQDKLEAIDLPEVEETTVPDEESDDLL